MLKKVLYPVTQQFSTNSGESSVYAVENAYAAKNGSLYPITHKYAAGYHEVEEDFAFVIRGDSYIVYCGANGETPIFTIDWGDGSKTDVNSFDIESLSHIYPSDREWTVTITDYISGWISFYHGTTTEQRPKLIKVLTPMPRQKNRTSFSSNFLKATSLISVPQGLFDKCTDALSFNGCFSGCSSLTSLPSGLFDKCTKVTGFNTCFGDCSSLLSIPSGLFDKCTDAVDLGWCFVYCSSVKFIPDGLFDNCTKALSFYACFLGDKGLIGHAPELWLRNNPTPDGKYCYSDCTKLDNYSQIPSSWK